MSQPTVTYITVTIPNGTAVSSAAFTGGLPIFAIQMPAAWDTAAITFQAAGDLSANVANVYDSTGVELNVTAAASQYIYLDPTLLAGASYIVVRSGTASTPVNQTADRKVTLVIRTV